MKANSLFRFVLILLLLLFSIGSVQAEKKAITKTFADKNQVDIHTVSGDCVVETTKGKKIVVQLTHDYPSDCFKAEFIENGSTLELKEDFSGSCSGHSLWKLTVPEKTQIKFKSASGDFSATGLQAELVCATASGDFALANIQGDVEIKTASGDVEAENIKGTFKVKTASGDYNLKNISGELDIKTASGDIEAEKIYGKKISIRGASSDIELEDSRGGFVIKTASGEIEIDGITVTGESEFKTASGDVVVTLAQSSDFNLMVASASGDATLDYNGNPIKGYFEFTVKKEDGKIDSPFKFDKQEVIYRYGQEYLKKSFTRKTKTPVIVIKTATGTAALKK